MPGPACAATCWSPCGPPRSRSAAEQPREASCAHAWPATVTGLTLLADRVRLSLDGQPPALADVTPDAVAELSLSPGCPVWLTVRPGDLEVYPRPDSAAGSVG